jgi:arylsulfatase
MADDLGFSDIGCYGGEIETPNLDRLAAEGIRFTQFYNNAKCTQTRAALLSGLYHHQTDNLKIRNHVTIAEALGAAGYDTLMVGKWHLGSYASNKESSWEKRDQPTRRGFSRYFGFLTGAINFFTGRDYAAGHHVMVLNEKPYQVPGEFYSTDAFSDYAVKFIEDAAVTENPFFLYLAHNSPHYPLHAHAEDIERYQGKYSVGWDEIRRRRYERMIQMGILDPNWPLTPRDEIVPDWRSLTKEQRRDEDLLMAVFAAMVHSLDRGIGRVIDTLDQKGLAENTLVVFLSDNGGCCWASNRDSSEEPGPGTSGRTYDTEWANVSNTPFRSYKQYSHEGGASTPFIARWPGVVESGSITSEIAHLIDIMPTAIEASGAEYPKSFGGHDVLPMEGRSLIPTFRGGRRDEAPVFWEYASNHAVRLGRWKLVAERSRDWELYDMAADRSELNDLTEKRPDLVSKLATLYDGWAKRTGAKAHSQCLATEASSQVCYVDPETGKELNRAEALSLRR